MNLPDGISFEETLLGSGSGTTVRGSENGTSVIVKTPEASASLFVDDFSDDEPKEDIASKQFELEKQREQQIAEKSAYFIKGHLKKEEDAVFWVRPFIERSLHEKVSFKEIPGCEELCKICRSITKALLELNKIDQSGHGNLKLGNVLIEGSDSSSVKLVDLNTTGDHERADKRAFGLIIYQLVNGEVVELDDKIVAVPDEQDWKVLGSTEKMWREFCSELLNPYGKYAESSWDEVEQALQSILAFHNKRKRLKAIITISGALFFFATLFVVWKLYFQEEKVVVDPDTIQGQWVELLDDYFTWGNYYLKSKSDFKVTDETEDFVDRFYDKKRAGLPMKIISRVTGQGARMQTVPEAVREEGKQIDILLLDNSKQQQIVLAHRLFTNLRKEIEDWEVLQDLQEANTNFVNLGFDFGSSKTQKLLDSISFEDGSLSLSRLYGLQSSVASLGELQDLYTSFEAQVAVLSSEEQSAFLPKYSAYLKRQFSQPSEDPISSLRSLVDTSAAIIDYWEETKQNLAMNLFLEDEQTLVATLGYSVSAQALDEWKSLVNNFRLIKIPLFDMGQSEFLQSQENILQLNEQINELQEPGVEAATFDQQFNQLFDQFKQAVRIPFIELNRVKIETAVGENLSELRSLVEKTEDRWAELNPDIGERLKQLSQTPDSLSSNLLEAWQSYIDSEVSVLTEESFSDTRDFILFQRNYFKKLKKFEYFQETQLAQLSSTWPETLPDYVRQDLSPALSEVRQSYYDRLVVDWIDQITPALLSSEQNTSLESLTDGFLESMEVYAQELLNYAQLLSETMDAIDGWSLPVEGISRRWDTLNTKGLRQDWSASAEFIPFVEEIKFYYDLDQKSGKDALLKLVEEVPSSSPFARSLVLEKIAQQDVLSPDELSTVANWVPEITDQVPDAKAAPIWQMLKSLWIQAFTEKTIDGFDRESIFTFHDVMGVVSEDLSGSQRFQFELCNTIAQMEERQEVYLESPILLKEVIENVEDLPEEAKQPELTELLSEMRGINLERSEQTFENAPFVKKGWKIERETEEQLILSWQEHRLSFYHIEDDEKGFFVAEEESSIALFNDWMTENKLWQEGADSLPREWEVFVSQPYNPIDDYRAGMKLWSITRRGLKRTGIMSSSKWFDVDPLVADEYDQVEADLFPVSALDETLPMQQTGARLAAFFAESMGMSLPTPSQWKLVADEHSAEDGYFWQVRLDSELSTELEAEVRTGSFYVDRKIGESGNGIDRTEVIARVGEKSDEPFKHLAGNVAEYLYDPEKETYYVAGGSALSSTLGTWKDEHLIPRRNEWTAFSDVGLRLALIAPEQSAYMQILNILRKGLS